MPYVGLIEGLARKDFQLGLARHLPHAGLGRQFDALGVGKGFELVIGRRMVLDHHGAKILDALIGRFLLRQVSEFHFCEAPFSSLFIEARIGV